MNKKQILSTLSKRGKASTTLSNGVYCEFITIRTQEAERVRLMVTTYGGKTIADEVFQFADEAVDYAERLNA